MFNNIKSIITILLIVLAINKIASQNNNQQLIHSHNDYLQNFPFWNAFSNGANSIEVDVFLKNKKLFVAHTEKEIELKNTIDVLYLNPLQNVINLKKANFQDIILLVDVKTEAYSTLKKLIKVLKKYPKIIQHPKIKIVISGNRPLPEDYTKYPKFIYFDHQELDISLSKESLNKVAMVSTGFKKLSQWNGKGRLTHEDFKRVKSVINKAKTFKKPFRFWATPDSKTAWKAFIDMGVNIINTDVPSKCVQYTKSLKNRVFTNKIFSEVYKPTFASDQKNTKVKNIILLIGDGNGLTQISSAVLANNGALSLTQLKSIGLIKTQSADDFTTDSAAAATALATGEKTNNRAIGTNVNGQPIKNITEILHDKGYLTGCITTDLITGATPASFYAHQVDRSNINGISTNLLSSKLNLFAGGGGVFFKNSGLKNNFKILKSIKAINSANSNHIGLFFTGGSVPSITDGRGTLLSETTKNSLNFFNKKQQPFFLMVEAAKIDSFGHANNTAGIVTETIDFDRAITEALKYADNHHDTLVIITADHETSGFSIPQGNLKNHSIEGDFTTHDHTGTMVPIFAYGPKSHLFTGVYENNEVFHKILKCIHDN